MLIDTPRRLAVLFPSPHQLLIVTLVVTAGASSADD